MHRNYCGKSLHNKSRVNVHCSTACAKYVARQAIGARLYMLDGVKKGCDHD